MGFFKNLFGGGKGSSQGEIPEQEQPAVEKVITPAEIATDIDNCIAKLPKCGLSEEEIAKYKDSLAQMRDKMKTSFTPQCDVKKLYTALDQIFQEPIMEIFTYGKAEQCDAALADIESSISAIEKKETDVNIGICKLEIQIYHASEYHYTALIKEAKEKKKNEEDKQKKLLALLNGEKIDMTAFNLNNGPIVLMINALDGSINQYSVLHTRVQNQIVSLETSVLKILANPEVLQKMDEISAKLTDGMVDATEQKMIIEDMKQKDAETYARIITDSEEMEELLKKYETMVTTMSGANNPASNEPNQNKEYNPEVITPGKETNTQTNDVPNIIA